MSNRIVVVMAFSLALLGLSLSSSIGFAQQTGHLLITDVDDTIKVSHVSNTINKVRRFLADPVPFAGMATLYRYSIAEAEARGNKAEFAVVSGAPGLLAYSVYAFLDLFSFPLAQEVRTRPMFETIRNFKYIEVADVIRSAGVKNASIIMIGDDTEFDPEVYDGMAGTMVARRDLQPVIYIRRVTNRSVPSTVIHFDSAADIAAFEFVAGRISRKGFEAVLDEVETETDLGRLFVPGEYCPTAKEKSASVDSRLTALPRDLKTRVQALEAGLRAACDDLKNWF